MSSVRVARRFSQLLSLNYNEHEDNPLVQLNAGKKVGILRAQKYQFFRCFPGGKRVSKKGKRDPLDSSKLTHMIIRNNNLRSSTLKMLHSFGCCQIGNHRQNSIDNLKNTENFLAEIILFRDSTQNSLQETPKNSRTFESLHKMVSFVPKKKRSCHRTKNQ